MSTEFNLAITAISGGAAGSVLTLIVSHLRDRQKESTIRQRLRAFVRFELQSVRDLIQGRMLDTAKSGRPEIPFLDTSIEVQNAERIIDSLQYPSLSAEIKLKSFDTELLNELQDVYLQIATMKAFRGYTSEHVFEYRRDFLENRVKIIDDVLRKLG